MKKFIAVAVVLAFGLIMTSGFAFAQQDKKGCKDHPLFTRMPNTYIESCVVKEFNSADFREPPTGKYLTIEGKYTEIDYRVMKGFEGKRSQLQVHRNYADAIKKIGGGAYQYTAGSSSLKLVKEGKEVWASVYGDGDVFRLTIVEKDAMQQEVTADAKFMAEGIGSTGHVAVYGIYFDFNKTDVKPESEPALQEINKLLSGNPSLKVFIVGHTDNVGGVDFNMKLSQARADAVVKALTTKYKINPQRLKAYGVGQLAPVAPNKTEEGRAKNRRVELVEQ